MLSIVAVVIDNLEVTQRFVSSIRQYTTGTYELILVDNGSKDKKAIAYFKKTADVYFRFPKITDLAKAWNKGIELAKGNYIAVANNDTVVPPNWFLLLKQILDKHKKAGMVSPITFWSIWRYLKWGNLKRFDKNFRRPFKLVKFKDTVWGEFFLFKKSALQKVGGYCELYKRVSGEDMEMNFQLYSKGYDIYVDPRVFVYHQGKASQIPGILPKKMRDRYWKDNYKLFKSRWSKYTKGW